MVFFFVCKIISIPEVILVLGVLLFMPIFLPLRDTDIRKKETWTSTPSNATLH